MKKLVDNPISVTQALDSLSDINAPSAKKAKVTSATGNLAENQADTSTPIQTEERFTSVKKRMAVGFFCEPTTSCSDGPDLVKTTRAEKFVLTSDTPSLFFIATANSSPNSTKPSLETSRGNLKKGIMGPVKCKNFWVKLTNGDGFVEGAQKWQAESGNEGQKKGAKKFR